MAIQFYYVFEWQLEKLSQILAILQKIHKVSKRGLVSSIILLE